MTIRIRLLCLLVCVLVFSVGLSPTVLMRYQTPVTTDTATTVDGVTIVYDLVMRAGASDRPVAVLLHGFAGNRGMMRMIAYALADRDFVCAAVDLRGHGSSEGLMGDLDAFGNDVDAVLESLRAKRVGDTSRIVLIGHSMGGGVLLRSRYSASAVAVVGIAPVASPEWVNTTLPQNLLLVLSTGDVVINATAVTQTFYQSVNGTRGANTPHTINGTQRELLVVEGVDHLGILYHEPVIGEIVKWSTRHGVGGEQTLTFHPLVLHASAYVALAGGAFVIFGGLSLALGTRRRQRAAASGYADRKTLARTGFVAIALGGSSALSRRSGFHSPSVM